MTKNLILSAYEAMAQKYSELIDYKPHNAFYDRPNTLELIREVQGKKVLDAACGPGKYAEILSAQGADLTGFDISPAMVRLARERNKDRGDFFVHDLDMPLHMFGNASFDIVLCALALHYMPDWTPAIKEFCRILKPGGILVISIEHPFFEYGFFRSKKYFEVELVSCTWKGFGTPVVVHSFRRPLGECIQPLTENGFYIDKLIEPKPTKEFEQYDPKHYKELNAFPAFMCIRAVKK